MSYIGVPPQTTFSSGLLDRFTSTTGTTVTLTHDIASENDIVVFVNFVKQDSTTYSVGGTGNKTLTLGGTLVSSDIVEVHYLNIVGQTNAPSAGSVTTATINDLAVTGAKLNTDVISAQTELASAPASTDELLISDAGVLKRVDVSLVGGDNTPAWKMGMSASQSLSYNTTTKINFNTSIIDTDSGVDTTNKRYTIPSGQGGKYIVYVFYRTGTGTDTASHDIFVYKNGSLLSDAEDMASFTVSQSYNTIQCTGMLDLAASDYIEIYARQADQNFTSTVGYSNEARFWGFKLIGV